MAAQKRILVVDDMEDWRKQVASIVTALGHTPIVAKDDIEAENLLDRESFDLIISDNKMMFPDSGLDLLTRESLLGREVPSILHTSELSPRQEQRLKKNSLRWLPY